MVSPAWQDILEYARWAPSPHNTQHWKFKIVDDRHLVLHYDPARLLPVEDPRGRFMAVAFGVLLESVSIAAAPLGLDVACTPRNVEFDATAPGPTAFADLKLIPRETPEPLDRELLLQRRTSRLPYDGQAVSTAQLDELVQVAAQFGHRLEHTQLPKEVKWVVGLNAETMYQDLRDKATCREIGLWARYSEAKGQQHGDGLSARAMLFPGWLMKLFFEQNWLFDLPILRPLGQWNYARTMGGTTCVAWISGPFDTQAECLHAGRMMARLWLTMSRQGLYLHPFGSVMTNVRSNRLLAERFANHARQHPLWMLARLGYGAVPPKALRLSLDDLLLP
jgi:hypothetical protein